jgi:hypothetical protein
MTLRITARPVADKRKADQKAEEVRQQIKVQQGDLSEISWPAQPAKSVRSRDVAAAGLIKMSLNVS